MPKTVGDILHLVEQIAPPHLAFSWDHIGLQIGRPDRLVRKAAVCLDCSASVLDQSIAVGCDLVIAHHPLIWNPLDSITPFSANGEVITSLIENKIAFIAAHTNWDCAVGGITDTLLRTLGFEPDPVPLMDGEPRAVFKLVTFAPAESVSQILDACSAAGAGEIGEYSRCAFFSDGTGTFESGSAAHPMVGKPGERTETKEVRIELRVPAHAVDSVQRALLETHPYETPAFDFISARSEPGQGSIRTSQLNAALSLKDLVQMVEEKLQTHCLAWGDPEAVHSCVGAAGGAAGRFWTTAQSGGASVYIVGEIAHDQVLAAQEAGMAIIQAGHFATENPGMNEMCNQLRTLGPDTEFIFAEPDSGFGGRPTL